MNWSILADKRENQFRIIQAIYRNSFGFMTFGELLTKTGLSKPVLSKHLRYLSKEEKYDRACVLRSKKGVYAINPNYKFITLQENAWADSKEPTLAKWREKLRGRRLHPKSDSRSWLLEMYIEDYRAFDQYLKHGGLQKYTEKLSRKNLSPEEKKELRQYENSIRDLLAEREKIRLS